MLAGLTEMMRSILIVAFLAFLSCSNEKAIMNAKDKSFLVGGYGSAYNIKLSLPSTFVSVRELTEEEQMDTTNTELNWILNQQFEHPDFFCFFDSVDTKLSIFVKTSSRVDVSDQERKRTYFAVPTAPLEKVFPPETQKRKIIYDSGEKKYKDRTYYKRIYQIVPDSLGVQEYLFITSRWQSTLAIINSSKDINLDPNILDYEIYRKPRE